MDGTNPKTPPPVVLTIAGSDSSGGAGIQADIKVFQTLGVYGATAITAITAQNSRGVLNIHPLPAQVIAEQINALLQDTIPTAVKTGMLMSENVVQTVAEILSSVNVPKIVVDPIIVSSSGSALLSIKGVQVLKEKLIPMATVITPNYPEAERLSGIPIQSDTDVIKAGQRILEMGCQAVVITGGHRKDCPKDLLMEQKGNIQWFESEFAGPDLHGTGCVFSAAVTSYLALNYPLPDVIARSKRYIYRAISERLIWNDHLQALNLFK
jgi:hydroxymethylpyrimidine kinase/phosphomethylpyrimidine kinase